MLKIVVIYYIVVNFILFAMMGFDKQRAVKGQWRIKEATLLMMGVVGGFVGGIFGMRVFHHKTKKIYFHLCYIFSTLLHILVFLFINGLI